jgi:hypothetical protein
VRLVESAFLGNEDWENEWFDSTSYGWGFLLVGFEVALDRHRGVPRQVAWPRRKVTPSRGDAYGKLLSAGALFKADRKAALRPGETYSLATVTGESYSGRVEFVREPRGFCLTVRELNDAVLWLTTEGAPGGIEAQAWLSAFAIDPSQLESLSETWQRRLQEIFQN